MKKTQKPNKEKFELFHCKVVFNFESHLRSDDLSNYIKEIDAQLMVRNISTSDSNKVVGTAKIYKVEIGRAINNHQSITDIFDSFDSELCDYYETLFDQEIEEFKSSLEKLTEPGMGSDLLIIDRVEILPKYRGMNLGLILSEDSMSNLAGGCQYIAIRPFPLQFGPHKDKSVKEKAALKYDSFNANEDKACKTIRNYWSQLGFIRVGKSTIFIKGPESLPPINLENLFKTSTKNISSPTKNHRTKS